MSAAENNGASANTLEQRVLSRPWFYRFALPSGAVTGSEHASDILAIHDTRWAMAEALLQREFPDGCAAGGVFARRICASLKRKWRLGNRALSITAAIAS